MKVEFLIVFEPERVDEIVNPDFLLELIQGLPVATDEGLSSDALTDSITITLRREVARNDNTEDLSRVICGFDLLLPEETSYPKEVVEQFADALSGLDGVLHLLKFYDESLLENNLKLAREVFWLEMTLRKALSLIYLTQYEDGFYNLLREDQVQIAKKDGEKPKPEEMEKSRENEFFHLLFSQYINLNKRRQLAEVKTILELIQQADSYDVFKAQLSRLPINDEHDGDFIISLKDLVKSIEELRNCIAHNRTPSEKALTNYTNSQVNLTRQLNEYLGRFNFDDAR